MVNWYKLTKIQMYEMIQSNQIYRYKCGYDMTEITSKYNRNLNHHTQDVKNKIKKFNKTDKIQRT